MIFGSFSIDTDPELNADIIRKAMDRSGLSFIAVSGRGFSGGFFLNGRLPFTAADFYHSDEANDLIVLMAGSIYNRDEISALYPSVLPLSDPGLVSRIFYSEGPGFVRKLNGDFVIFIYRPSARQAWLFRDQAGIRPVAFSGESGSLVFSSDITALSRACSGGKAIDTEYLLGYFKYIDYRRTPYSKVLKLLPGHYLEFSGEGTKVVRYWSPEKFKPDRALTHDRMLSDLGKLLRDAIKIRCDSRFTAGAHVSSGIDSGIVAALARKEYSRQDSFYGFSWSPENYEAPGEVKYDERDIVRKFCAQTCIHPVLSGMDDESFRRTVSSYTDNHGFFSEDEVLGQAVARNTNLIFSGWGGDEFISTGDRGIEQDLLRRLKLRAFFRRNPIRPFRKFVKNQLFYVVNPALGILGKNIARSFREDAYYIKKQFKKSDRKAIRNFYFHTSRLQFHLRMLQFYHLQERCESWYVNGYRKGVEYRYPLLDRRIIEYMLKVPSELLCETEHFRPLLREISDGVLPDEVRWNFSKNDPVYWSWMDELFAKAAVAYMDETEGWKANPDLHFVDFDLLKQDIAKYMDHSAHERPKADDKILFRTLVYLKAVHGFSLDYRK